MTTTAVVLDLPLEIILLVRNFLIHIFEYEVVERGELDSIEKYVIQEGFWSWRNFLSVRNDANWNLIRKRARLWNLNRFESEKYLKDALFRNYIHENMLNSEQLHCKLAARTRPVEFSPLLKETLNIGMLGSLYLTVYFEAELPSCSSLRVITLQQCSQLKKLGNYPKLQTLNLLFCGCIDSVGEMSQLSSISFHHTNTRILPSFPLEQLEELALDGSHELVLSLLSRFHRLQSLRIGIIFPISTPVHFLIPSLTSLVLHGFDVIDITGLHQLKALDVAMAGTVIGKEMIYPQLISLTGSNEVFLKEALIATTSTSTSGNKLKRFSSLFFPVDKLADCLPLLSNVSEVSLQFTGFYNDPPTDVTFHVGQNMNSLVIGFHHSLITGLSPETRTFRKLTVAYFTGMDLTTYQNIQQLTLWECSEIQDIQSIRNVPYLSIRNCRGIQDFSCLGAQRYLEIDSSDSLSDETISEKFGDILSLNLSYCNSIRKFVQDSLAQTRRLQVIYCQALEEVSLAGTHYSTVSIKECENDLLTKVSITGKVYLLQIPERFWNSIQEVTYAHKVEYFDDV
jgi:hypothetical protein